MSPPKKTLLEPLRPRILRLQFTGGIGFLALTLGGVLSAALSQRLSTRIQELPFDVLQQGMSLAIRNLWVLGVLPVLCYGAARVVELRPWPTAVGAALSGQVVVLALKYLGNGLEGWVEHGWLSTALEWAVLGLGVWITQRAVVRGRADVARQQEQAQRRAAARKDEYAEFLQAAERGGEKLAQRETPAPVVPETPPGSVPAEAPATTGEGTAEPKPEDGQKPPPV